MQSYITKLCPNKGFDQLMKCTRTIAWPYGIHHTSKFKADLKDN